MLLCCLVSCKKEDDNEKISEPNSEESEWTPTYDLPPKETITTYRFTGTAIEFPSNDTMRVRVNEEYQDTFGETVTVIMEGLDEMTFCMSDDIYIYVDAIKGSTYFTIRAKKIVLVNDMMVDKPVIYLYPEESTICSVKVELDGRLTCTYPEHGESGWQGFTARPDGTLIFPDGKEYYCLYWEGICNMAPDFSKGFCVKGEDVAEFLDEILIEIGLTPREANEFIIYWLPQLQENEYNLISFQSEAYTDVADLIITPVPDSLLRVYMVARPLDNPVDIEPQTFDGFTRDGFTVVEWGGSILK